MENTEDLSSIRKGERKEALAQEQKDAAFETLIASEGGRRWIWDELTACHVFRTSFTGNSHTFFNEGERNRGLALLNQMLNVDPDAFIKMIKENNDDTE